MKRTLLLKITAIAIGTIVSLFVVEIFLRFQNIIKLEGTDQLFPWNNVLHHGSDEFVIKEYGHHQGSEVKILLLGDSWMEDEHLSGTIGLELSGKLGKYVKVVNGGISSYSPTLYLIKARQAYSKYGKFDYIIINIDETDIGDEWIRYRIPTLRDKSGKIVAVPYDSDIASMFFWNGKLWAENSNIYILRLIKKIIWKEILLPVFYEFTLSSDHYSNLMKYVFANRDISSYYDEYEHFEDRSYEMLTEIFSFAFAPNNVYITHHPHLRGLVNEIEDGKFYLPIVSETLKSIEKQSGGKILDARDHIMQIHGDKLLNDTFVAGDPFSHLNTAGAIRYGKWIVGQIELE